MLKKKHKPKKKKKLTHKRKPTNLLRLYQITITNHNGATDTHPKKQIISTPNGDEVVWRAPGQGIWTVTFDGPNGSPFNDSVFSNKPGYPDHSGPAKPGTPNADYKYTAQIEDATPEDPIIHTDP